MGTVELVFVLVETVVKIDLNILYYLWEQQLRSNEFNKGINIRISFAFLACGNS